ncbi:DUF4133 domain-containing protein [Pontibacter mangrovi]|uniref:DUF4133 domain-containing protein n=1 Tax=Pontibacter mangrovi TaxID=2589816 RepID=A0A501VTM8_9BACT|nr:DUF4133 domain-containing protein [Pontibacter mangrovi]TPE39712.1 DUF4133 domain-containing protein [Pontibacter mangrovi]
MDPRTEKGYAVYRGLQRPLVFRSLKGRYIYWGLGCVLSGFLAAVLLSVSVSFLAGGLAQLLLTFGGLSYTLRRQRRGLHPKTRARGVYLVPFRWRPRPGLFHHNPHQP